MCDHVTADQLSFNIRLARNATMDSWRITLYDPQTGSTLRFTSLAQLDAFLRIITRSTASEASETAED